MDWFRKALVTCLSVVLCLYTIVFVNFTIMQPQSALAVFVLLGLVLCFLVFPASKRIVQPDPDLANLNPGDFAKKNLFWRLDIISRWVLAALSLVTFAYLVIQTEPAFKSFWPEGFSGQVSLGDRAGDETNLDYWFGLIGLFLVLEATRRCIGWIVPALALLFILHAYFAPGLPEWLLPHQGMNLKEITSATVLQSTGVLGQAAGVMFRYVFLFVVFGAFLEMSGATQFIIDFSHKLFGRGVGGPAKVAVVGSGLMGSLSGSAVANAVTTGSFTIPVMRDSGFDAKTAGGITAAAATGGALVPPVMGAGAYMMLEFVQPNVSFFEIARAAVIPAFLYYFSLWMIVHNYSKKISSELKESDETETARPISLFESVVFFGALGVLILLLCLNFSPYKSVTGSLVVILFLAIFRKQLELGFSPRLLAVLVFVGAMVAHQFTVELANTSFFENSVFKSFLAPSWLVTDQTDPTQMVYTAKSVFDSLLLSSFIGMLALLVFGLVQPKWRPQIVTAFQSASRNGIALVAASACVGIIIGIVSSTPMASEFAGNIKSVVETSLLLALIGIMGCSIVLGMGVPSVVCYLLMATLMGSLLGELGVAPLAAHLFIFYFGMMSMVTPPVALAAYASASIAKAPVMSTAFSSFKFSLVGFTLPFMFIYRPALLLMGAPGEELFWGNVVSAIVMSTLGVIALAAAVTGYMRNILNVGFRVLLVIAAILLLAPNVGGRTIGLVINVVGAIILCGVAFANRPATGSTGAVSESV